MHSTILCHQPRAPTTAQPAFDAAFAFLLAFAFAFAGFFSFASLGSKRNHRFFACSTLFAIKKQTSRDPCVLLERLHIDSSPGYPQARLHKLFGSNSMCVKWVIHTRPRNPQQDCLDVRCQRSRAEPLQLFPRQPNAR